MKKKVYSVILACGIVFTLPVPHADSQEAPSITIGTLQDVQHEKSDTERETDKKSFAFVPISDEQKKALEHIELSTEEDSSGEDVQEENLEDQPSENTQWDNALDELRAKIEQREESIRESERVQQEQAVAQRLEEEQAVAQRLEEEQSGYPPAISSVEQADTSNSVMSVGDLSSSRTTGDYGSDAINKLISVANTQLGVPYVWGGTSPGVGLDCSGFTQYVYREALGIEITRTTYTQINQGKVISNQADVKPGDLIFPHTGHVGLAISNTQMIHAPQTGDVVKVAPIYSFMTARRIV